MTNTDVTIEQDLLSLESAADLLCVSKSTMYRLLDQGKLRGMKAGKQWRFQREHLLEYMKRGPAALALENVSAEVVDAEVNFLTEELGRAGAIGRDTDDGVLDGKEGKIEDLFRKMVSLLIAREGSDIHLEPIWNGGSPSLLLRMRIYGALQEIRRLPTLLSEPLALECKRLAGLPIDTHDRPQSGNALLKFGDMQVMLRISTVPIMYGEKIAVRLIPMKVPTLEMLGIENTPLKAWMQRRSGLILVTGPTGSGKTTSMVACVQERVSSETNILSVQHPIEYLQPGVTQLRLEKFSRAEGIRSILQQDPDIIIAGELTGEPELVQEVIGAAGTGHLVIATMHAHDAITPLFELVECGVKRSLIAANLIGVVNQHLLRTLCDCCKVRSEPSSELLREISRTAGSGAYCPPESTAFYEAAGCEKCNGTGYQSRFALHEYFSFTPDLRKEFTGGCTRDELVQLAREQGIRSSLAEAVSKAADGITSLDEVMRNMPEWR